jgi:hypothetical protein
MSTSEKSLLNYVDTYIKQNERIGYPMLSEQVAALEKENKCLQENITYWKQKHTDIDTAYSKRVIQLEKDINILQKNQEWLIATIFITTICGCIIGFLIGVY